MKSIIKNVKVKLSLKRQQDKPKTEYTDLAPIDEIENGDEYLNALDWALNNDRVKNIALAGPYGAGKSSIIETYLKKHLNLKKNPFVYPWQHLLKTRLITMERLKKLILIRTKLSLEYLSSFFIK